jgi:XTP/dITP diphosphohydrolase
VGTIKNNVRNKIMELVFATHNDNKVKEVQAIMPAGVIVKSLKDLNILEEIPEPYDTIEENSITKAKYISYTHTLNCFSEDTGLIVPSINGEPGVRSARYAGDDANAENNMKLLLQKLDNDLSRDAYFKTVITLIADDVMHQFTGICTGTITLTPSGAQGFGYDPIFMPEGADKVFAEMNIDEKNLFSHRKKAVAQLLSFLQAQV